MPREIITRTVRGRDIRIDVDSTEGADGPRERNWELWRADSYETKEPDTLDWIDTFVSSGDVLYDVGANIGQYSLYAAAKTDGGCRIYAFEPEALNYAKLNRNIVANQRADGVTAYCLAVAGKTALDVFYVKSFSPGASLHCFGKPETQGEIAFDPQNKQGMIGVSLDDLVYTFGLPCPTHIKVDVDGIEEDIVAGADRLLADSRLASVLIEVYMHKQVADRIIHRFEERGFRLSNRDLLGFEAATVENLIFTRA